MPNPASLPLSLVQLKEMQEALVGIEVPEPLCSNLAKLFVQAERAAALEEALAGIRTVVETSADRTSFRLGKIGAEILLCFGDGEGLSVPMPGNSPECIVEEGMRLLKRRLIAAEVKRLRELAQAVQEELNRSKNKAKKKFLKNFGRELQAQATKLASKGIEQ